MGKVIPISSHKNYKHYDDLQKPSTEFFYLDAHFKDGDCFDGRKFNGYSKPGYYFYSKDCSEVYGPFERLKEVIEALDKYLDKSSQ